MINSFDNLINLINGKLENYFVRVNDSKFDDVTQIIGDKFEGRKAYLITNNPINDSSSIQDGTTHTVLGMEYEDRKYGYQISFGFREILFRLKKNGTWSTWRQLDTNVLKDSDITYFTPNNVENHPGYGNCYYYKIGSKVHLHVGVKITAKTNTKIYTLPAKYRPITTIGITGLGDSLSSYSTLQINTEGLITINSQFGYALIDVEFDTLN